MNAQEQKKTFWNSLSPLSWAGLILYIVVISAVMMLCPVIPDGEAGTIAMLVASWGNPAYDYNHGWLIIPLCIWMLLHSIKKLDYSALSGSGQGLWVIALGCLFFLIAVHSKQWRIASGSLPFFVSGAVWFFWGKRAFCYSFFPIFFFLMSIPVPGFQQATSGMQIMATSGARWCTNLLGIQTIQEGTNLTLVSAEWSTFSIAGGCSGMRSLMALVMISFAWAYLADSLALWKRIFLALSAIPLAIIANAFRVASIFICGEFISPAFASKTWHDWSGLIFFFPASLLGLCILHSILAGELPFFHSRRLITRTTTGISRKESTR